MSEPYIPQSRLLAQVMARRHAPVQSVGQGIADVIGDVGTSYLEGRAERKAQKQDSDSTAAILSSLMSGVTPQKIATHEGNYVPAQEAFPNGAPNMAGRLEAEMRGQAPMQTQQAQQAFPAGFTDQLPPAQQAMYAVQQAAKADPAAMDKLPMAMQLAQSLKSAAPRALPGMKPGDQLPVQDASGNISFTPVPGKVDEKTNPEMDVALWVNGGDDTKAREWLKGVKTPKGPEDKPAAPPTGYRWTNDGKSLETIPGGPAVGEKTTPPAGYRWTADGKTLEAIPGGPAEIGPKGLPQTYKDQHAAYDTLESALNEYKAKVQKQGTESWNVTEQTKMQNLEKQILLSIKDIAKTGTLDQGSIDVMGTMIPDATSFGANANFINGATKALANVESLRDYAKRGRAALDNAYKGEAKQSPPSGVKPEEWAAMSPEDKALFPQ